MSKKFAELDYIIRYEQGDLRGQEVLELFAHLIKNRLIGSLQGSYSRVAGNLIDRGYIDANGKILKDID